MGMDSWELGIEEKSGIWELRVETWELIVDALRLVVEC